MYFTKIFLEKIYRIGALLIGLLVILDLFAFFFYPDHVLGEIFLATREKTPLTWMSAVTFLLIGFASLTIYQKSRQKIWYVITVLFLFFSIDDATYIHERLSGLVIDNTSLFSTFPSYIWPLLYAPLLLGGFGLLIKALWKGRGDKKILLQATSLLGLSVLLDLIDGFTQKKGVTFHPEPFMHDAVLHILRLTEEVSETVAVGAMAFILIYAYCLIDKKEKDNIMSLDIV